MTLNWPPRGVLRLASTAAPENLALEEWLLEQTRPGDWRLLIYRNGPGVVVGRNQNAWRECNMTALREAGAAVFRRVTGGGAVWHDAGNLNFSFVAGRDSYCAERQFSVVCRALETCGIQPVRSPQNALLAGGLKFSGSAFRLTRSGAIHHGTLLVESDLARLERCLSVPDAGGLSDKAVRSIRARVGNLAVMRPGLTIAELSAALIAEYRRDAGDADAPVIDIAPGSLGGEFDEITARHAGWEWRLGESPPFALEGRAGEWAVRLTVENGIIREATFTEVQNGSLNKSALALSGHLTGRRFDRDALEAGVAAWQAANLPSPEIERQVWKWLRGLNA